MVEEMYQQESKEEEEREGDGKNHHTQKRAQSPMPAPPATAAAGKRSEINAQESDPSHKAINRHLYSENQAELSDNAEMGQIMAHLGSSSDPCGSLGDTCRIDGGGEGGTAASGAHLGPSCVRFGSAGDVSLTLGLRHAGNMPEKTQFSVSDFGGL